jgi:hypothetical protein
MTALNDRNNIDYRTPDFGSNLISVAMFAVASFEKTASTLFSFAFASPWRLALAQ